MNLEDQIKRVLKQKKIDISRIINSSRDELSDIYSGEIYQNFMNKNFSFFLNGQCLSLSFATDGISFCSKSKLSMWPLIFVINELPLETRFCIENIIIGG